MPRLEDMGQALVDIINPLPTAKIPTDAEWTAVGSANVSIGEIALGVSSYEIATSELTANTYTVFRNIGAGPLTLTTQGPETINSLTSFLLPAGWWAQFIPVAGNWVVVSAQDQPQNVDPVTNFTISTSSLDATFLDTSTDPDGSITSWLWTFHDGSTSSVQSPPTLTHALDGTYSVTLEAFDNLGASTALTKSYSVSASAVDSLAVTGATPVAAWFINNLGVADGAQVPPIQDSIGGFSFSGNGSVVYNAAGIGSANIVDGPSFMELPAGSESAFDFIHLANPQYTIAMVVKLGAGSFTSFLETNAINAAGIYFAQIGNDRLKLYQYGAAGTSKILTTAALLDTSLGWASIILSVSGDSTQIFVNNISVQSGAAPYTPAPPGTPHGIVKIEGASAGEFRDLRIFNSPWSISQRAEYQAAALAANFFV